MPECRVSGIRYPIQKDAKRRSCRIAERLFLHPFLYDPFPPFPHMFLPMRLPALSPSVPAHASFHSSPIRSGSSPFPFSSHPLRPKPLPALPPHNGHAAQNGFSGNPGFLRCASCSVHWTWRSGPRTGTLPVPAGYGECQRPFRPRRWPAPTDRRAAFPWWTSCIHAPVYSPASHCVPTQAAAYYG